MANYNYQLENNLTQSFVDKQSEKLLKDWYKYNEKESSYDLYEFKYEEVEYVDFYYTDEVDVKSQLSEYEVYKKRKIVDARYKTLKKEKGISGFFRNIFNKFVSKTEEDVDQTRIEELELLLAKWEIKDFQKIESFNIVWKVEKLTEKEVRTLQKEGIKYSFLRRLVDEYKMETQEVTNKLTKITFQEYVKNYESEYKTEIIERYTEKEVVEKLVADRRVVMETAINFYIPGVWSRQWNHDDGTKAEFSCQVIIQYISWFNPFDRGYFSKEKVKGEIIKIINEEHPTTGYIRDRFDNKDGFDIDSTTTH
jgi:hypothetical protein